MLILLFISSVISISALEWELFLTDVSYLTMRANIMWKLEGGPYTGAEGRQSYLWNDASKDWILQPSGLGVSIILSSTHAYLLNEQKRIYQRLKDNTGSAWMDTHQDANDIKVSGNERIWIASNTATSGGFTINELNPSSPFALTLHSSQGAKKVAAGSDDTIWIVTDTGAIKRYSPWTSTWENIPGSARDIYVAYTGIPYIVGTTEVEGGYEIKKWNNVANDWETLEGIGGESIAIDDRHNVHVVTRNFSVYRQIGASLYNFCPSNR